MIESYVVVNFFTFNFSFSYVPEYPPPQLLPILERLKSTYALWYGFLSNLPKTHRYSLGSKIDTLFIETIEAVATAAFLTKEEKLPSVKYAIRKLDIIKILLLILWENQSLDNKKYLTLSEKLNEVGKMLGGWQGQLQKKTLL